MNKIPFVAGIVAESFFNTACKDEYMLCNLSKEVRITADFYKKVDNNPVVATSPKMYALAK